jgi:MFS family permease
MQQKLTNLFHVIISLPATAMGFALSVQISALSWLLSTQYHLDIHEIGLVWAAGPLAGIIGQVVIGLISDRVWFWGGRRRPFILVGGTLAALMLFLLPRIDAINDALGIGNLLIVAVAVALTLDLSINISFNPTRSIIADVTPEGNPRTKGYTWMQTISGFWGVMAYVLGASFGNFTLIAAGVVIVFLFSVVPTFFITEPRDLEARAEEAGTRRATNWPQLWRIYVAHGFSWIGVQAMFVYIIAFIQQKMIPDGMSAADASAQSGQIIAIAFAVLNTVGFLLPAFVLEPIAERIGRVKTHLSSVGIMAAGYFAIAWLVSSPLALYALMAVVGIGWGAIVSLPFAIMSEEVDRGRMGFYMGIFNLSVVLPQLFVSLVLGRVIQDAPDKAIIFIICGGTLAASSLLWLLVRDTGAERGTVHGTAGASSPGAPSGH